MAKHKHTMVLDSGDDGCYWFFCESCSALVEIVASAVGNKLTTSARVRAVGFGGFSLDELLQLNTIWLVRFRAFVECRSSARPARRRRRVKFSEPRVSIWAHSSGVDLSAV
jgi:hypothetical protein